MIDESVYEQLVDAIEDDAVYLIDPQGRILTWSRGAERVNGYAASEIVGRSFELLYLASDIVAGAPYLELECVARLGRFQGVGYRKRADGSVFRALTTMVPVHRPTDGVLVGYARTTALFDRLGANGVSHALAAARDFSPERR